MHKSRVHRGIPFFLLSGIAFLSAMAWGQTPVSSSPPTLTTAQIVQRMEDRNQERSDRLRHYTAVRHYRVEYRGFPASIAASMVVEVTYDAPSSKQFHILSQTGSGLLVDRVLKKLLKSEQEAAENQSRNALTTANYSFALVGNEIDDGRRLYVLQVEPRGDNKLLYRGRIWVDADDYAVARIEAQPAQNPSFWIRNTEIHHMYSKTGDFWLPASNRSETKVRIGGTATLTIDYGTYRIGPSGPPPSPLPEAGSAAQ